jgi:hypothetical protein
MGNGCQERFEELGCPFPRKAEASLAHAAAVEHEGAPDRRGKVAVERSRHPVLNNIDRAWHVEGRDRRAAHHGFEHDEPEGVGPAGKHEDIGRRQRIGIVLAEKISGKERAWIFGRQLGAIRPVADDDL